MNKIKEAIEEERKRCQTTLSIETIVIVVLNRFTIDEQYKFLTEILKDENCLRNAIRKEIVQCYVEDEHMIKANLNKKNSIKLRKIFNNEKFTKSDLRKLFKGNEYEELLTDRFINNMTNSELKNKYFISERTLYRKISSALDIILKDDNMEGKNYEKNIC